MEAMQRKSNKRTASSDESETSANQHQETDDTSKAKARKPSMSTQKGMIAVIFLSTAALGRNVWKIGAAKPKTWWILLSFVASPVGLAVSVALSSKVKPHQRMIALAALSAVLGNVFPKFISVFLVCSGMVWFGLSTRTAPPAKQNGGSNNRGQSLTAMAAIAMTLSLLMENFFIWVVSATYYPSHQGYPEPLQDNGRLLQTFLLQNLMGLNRRDVVQIRGLMNVQWVLVSAAFMAFIVAELQWLKKRTFSGLALRALATFATVRAIRTISFLLTVLPSQNPNCYRQHFPLPPNDWISWLMVGMHPQTHGGCNDLIISGHACVTSTMACLAISAAGNMRFSIALWSLLVLDFCIEVYEGFHYSVDMWMGGLITFLLWRSFSWLEDEAASDNRELLPMSSVTTQELVHFSIPAFITYVVVVVLPEAACNYVIVGYVLFSAGYIERKGFSHFVQHALLCLSFMALAMYL